MRLLECNADGGGGRPVGGGDCLPASVNINKMPKTVLAISLCCVGHGRRVVRLFSAASVRAGSGAVRSARCSPRREWQCSGRWRRLVWLCTAQASFCVGDLKQTQVLLVIYATKHREGWRGRCSSRRDVGSPPKFRRRAWRRARGIEAAATRHPAPVRLTFPAALLSNLAPRPLGSRQTRHKLLQSILDPKDTVRLRMS
jgi:hypothetical protein